MVHNRGSRLQRDILAAGIDQIEIFLARRCNGAVPDDAVLRMINDVAIANIGVRAHRGNTNTQVDDPAVFEFECNTVRHLLAAETFGRSAHLRRSWRRVGHSPSGAGGTLTNLWTKMPGVCT